MTQLIVRIGPLTEVSGQAGKSAYMLIPGDPDQPFAFGDTLAEVIPDLEGVRTQPLACEPALAAEARPFGIPVRPLDDDAREILSLIALDLAVPAAFAGIERNGLIFQFCRAASDFAARNPAVWPDASRLLRCRIAGVAGEHLMAIVAGPGIALLDRDPGTKGLVSPVDADGLGAILAPGRPEILDALARAHGLHAVPEPFRLVDAQKHAVTDEELALLTAALFAVNALADQPDAESSGHVLVDGCGATVRLSRTD